MDEKEKILNEHIDVIDMVAKRLYLKMPRFIEYDDLRAEMAVAYVEGYDKWDESRGNFPMFISNYIRTAGMNYLRSFRSKRIIPAHLLVGLETEVSTEDGAPITWHDVLCDSEHRTATEDVVELDGVRHIVRQLQDPIDRKIIKHLIVEGLPMSLVSDIIGMEKSWVYRRWARIKKLLKKEYRGAF